VRNLRFTEIIPVTAVVLALSLARAAVAADQFDAKAYQQAVDRAIRFLETKGQAADGSYAGQTGVGVTAIVATAIMRHGRSADDPLVAKSLEYLQKFVQPDGGIYVPGTFYQNYETCLGILCFTEANRDGRYAKLIQNADQFVKSIQWGGDGQKTEKDSLEYGGAGYGKSKRPDLSNTQFFIEALRAAGNGPNDEAVQRAIIFVSRCQNLETENNASPFAAKNPDGGFYYTPAAGGTSMAGKTAEGGLRSYGSMTYAGLKSMIHAGVGPEDPRVKAALKWIGQNYGVDTNPGMGDAGLYYYYHTFAKALGASGLTAVADANGVKHDWRADLLAELVRRQRPDGSWINDNNKWMESDPTLVTGYALLSLAYCRPAVAR
jgi:squalene-hopene/tetraprenyl-beta-curcumene cyclase